MPSSIPEAPPIYAWLQTFVRAVLAVFFRNIEVSDLHNIPMDRGGVIVSWHPNGLIDPALILSTLPRQVIFGARHGLFRLPLLGRMIQALDTVPIYRSMDLPDLDPEQRKSKNEESLLLLAKRIANGRFSALFPEGTSHDAPHLIQLRAGAAKLYYQARIQQAPDALPPVLIPVGLHYDQKKVFRSKALVVYHPPIELPTLLDVTPGMDESEESQSQRATELTCLLNQTLNQAIYGTENWEIHELLHRARKLVRAERGKRAGHSPGRTDMEEKVLGLARIWIGYHSRLETHPKVVAKLVSQVREYDADLKALGIEDHELDTDPKLFSLWLLSILVLQGALVFLLLPPIVLAGYAINLPPAILLDRASSAVGKMDKDMATLKVLGGAVLFPMVWLGCAVLAAWMDSLNEFFPGIPNSPLLAGVTAFLFAMASAFICLNYIRLGMETARAFKVRLTKRIRQGTIYRLRKERAALHDLITPLAEGLELPGHLEEDGSVHW
jgi:glycerol-3-phosphate O-acyltransferase / dihydroxyacetone phosphate acyltransferase